jgi:hypothetical protein
MNSAKEQREESREEGFETMYEINREFITDGSREEADRAERRLENGEEERYGRVTRMSALAAELQVTPELSEQSLERMKGGLQFKRDGQDAWGIAFTLGYFQRIREVVDPEKAKELDVDLTDGERELIIDDMKDKYDFAKENPETWETYLAMAEHISRIEPKLFQTLDFTKEEIEDGVAECLEAKKDDPIAYAHIAATAELCRNGFLRELKFEKEDIKDAVRNAVAAAREAEERGDHLRYAFGMSEAKKLYNTLFSPEAV